MPRQLGADYDRLLFDIVGDEQIRCDSHEPAPRLVAGNGNVNERSPQSTILQNATYGGKSNRRKKCYHIDFSACSSSYPRLV